MPKHDKQRREQGEMLELMGYQRAGPNAWESPGCAGGYVVVTFKPTFVVAKALDGDNTLRAWRQGTNVTVALEDLRVAMLYERDAYQALADMTDVARRLDDD